MTLSLAISLLSLQMSILPSCAAEPASPQAIVKALTDAKAVREGQKFSAKLNGETIIISTWDNDEKLTNEQCKVEAILISKTLVDNFPDHLCYETLFYSPLNRTSYRKVIVQQALLHTFEKGGIGEEQMLNTLNVIKGTGPSETAGAGGTPSYMGIVLKTGPFAERRKDLLDGIKGLGDQGVGVTPFIQAFKAMEDQVDRDDASVVDSALLRLERSVKEQYDALSDARNRQDSPSFRDANRVTGSNSQQVTTVKAARADGKVNRWALGFFPLPERKILENPSGFWAESINAYKAKTHSTNPQNLYFAALWFASVLETNGRAHEAQRFKEMSRSFQ
ncbi:MAG: hypothetical protein KC777_20210 [Cyanobacteria bacterium HKST-UBA02]|nr:hypothetical protein [Cyanobacteria bacterium HKST-UBA02]